MTLYIAEFDGIADDGDGSDPIIYPAPVANTSAAVGASSAQSAELDGRTRFVRLKATSDCFWKLGTNPTAASTDTFMGAGDVMDVQIDRQGLKFAAIQV